MSSSLEKKKVVFIEPRGSQSNVFAKFMKIPMVGPAVLATIARDAGYDAQVLNENILGREVTDEELVEADIIGLSCLTSTVNRGKEISEQYRKVRKKNGLRSKVLIGGIHASMMPEDVIDIADHVLVGEGEDMILRLLDGSIKDKIVKGISVQKLDDVPIPDFSLVKDHHKMKHIPVMTSRGCPYDCDFCCVTEMFGRGYKFQSPERVMKELSQYPGKHVFIVDDHFAVNPTRTDRLLKLLTEAGLNQKLSAQTRIEVTQDPERVAMMKKAGIHTVYVGFESVNPKALKELNKKQTVEGIEAAIKVFHRFGINIHGMFMFGADSDGPDVFRATADFVKRTGVDYAQYMVLTPLPGTRTYKKLEAERRLLHKDWELYDAMHAVFEPAQMTAEELQQGMIDAYGRFYSYRSGIRLAIINTLFNTYTITRKIRTKVNSRSAHYKEAYFRSTHPTIMRFIGKSILKDWLKKNRPYLNQLRQMSRTRISLRTSVSKS